MQFQVKGPDYFLEYIDEEHSWFVFTQAADGLQRIPVYVDGKNLLKSVKTKRGLDRKI